MLTPSAKDKNRKDELKRKKAQPQTFCSNAVGKLAEDWKRTGLVDTQGKHLGTDPRLETAKDDELNTKLDSLATEIEGLNAKLDFAEDDEVVDIKKAINEAQAELDELTKDK